MSKNYILITSTTSTTDKAQICSVVTDEQLENFAPIFDGINEFSAYENHGKEHDNNFNITGDLEDGELDPIMLYNSYVDSDTMREFMNLVPEDTEEITSIKVLETAFEQDIV